MLGEVVSEVCFTGRPVDVELSLFDSVSNPIESHVDCLGLVLLDGSICDSISSAVVGSDWSCGLGMSHLVKCDTQRDCFSGC